MTWANKEGGTKERESQERREGRKGGGRECWIHLVFRNAEKEIKQSLIEYYFLKPPNPQAPSSSPDSDGRV